LSCRKRRRLGACIGTTVSYDVIIVGSSPKGLAAAITLAQAGLSVIVYEAQETLGDEVRSAHLTLPGFVHDICSAATTLHIRNSGPCFNVWFG
jgi:phytoene dehydrogenase-like protein